MYLNAESRTQDRIRYQLVGGNVDSNKDVGCLGGCHMEAGSWQLLLKFSCAWLFPYYVVKVRTNNIVINAVVPLPCTLQWVSSNVSANGQIADILDVQAMCQDCSAGMQKWPHVVC